MLDGVVVSEWPEEHGDADKGQGHEADTRVEKTFVPTGGATHDGQGDQGDGGGDCQATRDSV